MTLLERLRLSPRWLVVLVGVAAILVATASLTAHKEPNGKDGANCLVCKAGQQPLRHLVPALAPERAAPRSSVVPKETAKKAHAVFVEPRSSRAPPA